MERKIRVSEFLGGRRHERQEMWMSGLRLFHRLFEKVKDKKTIQSSEWDELYRLKLALIGNNELLILSTRIQILTRFFYTYKINNIR